MTIERSGGNVPVGIVATVSTATFEQFRAELHSQVDDVPEEEQRRRAFSNASSLRSVTMVVLISCCSRRSGDGQA